MKRLMFLLLCLTLLLVGCEKEEITPEMEGTYNPLLCMSKSSSRCGVDWHFFFGRNNFPENIQIVINDKVIIDDCEPRSQWRRDLSTRTVEYTINEYANIESTQKFNMRIFDRNNCSSQRSEHSFAADLTPTIKTIGGVKEIWVERDLN